MSKQPSTGKTSYQENQKCFIAHSQHAPWNTTIIDVCNKVIPTFGLEPWYANAYFDATTTLRDKVVEMIATAHYGIYDLSSWNDSVSSQRKTPQNVWIELGIAITLNRPTLLLRHTENRLSNVSLPQCLESVSEHIYEFSGGGKSLRSALQERIPEWIQRAPEQDWYNHHCLFGDRVCAYRELHPVSQQWKHKHLRCHLSDGTDIDREDFRALVEEILERFSNVKLEYLDTCALLDGYQYVLCSRCQMVRSTPFAIYRITPNTSADTFIAIGMSIALEKQFGCTIPKLLIAEKEHYVPSLLRGYEVVIAETDREIKDRLQQFLPLVIQQVRQTVWKPQALPFEVFISHINQASKENVGEFFRIKMSEFLADIASISERIDDTIAGVARSRESLSWAELLQLMEDVTSNPRDIEYVTKLARQARELLRIFQLNQHVLSTIAEVNSLLRSHLGEEEKWDNVIIPSPMRSLLVVLHSVSEQMDTIIVDVARSRESLSWSELSQLVEDVMSNPRDIEYVTRLARKARELNRFFQLHQDVLNTWAQSNTQLRDLLARKDN